jgi:hypothetical protein
MLSVAALSRHFDSIPRDFTVVCESTQVQANRLLLSTFSSVIRGLDPGADRYSIPFPVSSAALTKVLSFVHASPTDFGDDAFDSLVVAGALDISALLSRLSDQVQATTTESNFQTRFDVLSHNIPFTLPLVRFLTSQPPFAQTFIASQPLSPAFVALLFSSATSLFPTEDSKIDLIFQCVNSWNLSELQAVSFQIHTEKLSEISVYRLLHNSLSSSLEPAINSFGLIRLELELRQKLLLELDELKPKLIEIRQECDFLLTERSSFAQVHDSLNLGRSRSELLVSQLRLRILDCSAQFGKMGSHLSVVRSHQDLIAFCLSAVTNLAEIANRLIVPFQSYCDNPLSRIAYPGARLDSVISAKGLIGATEAVRHWIEPLQFPVEWIQETMAGLDALEKQIRGFADTLKLDSIA